MTEPERKREKTDDDPDACFTYHENWEQLQCCCGDMIEGSHECETTMKKVSIRRCFRPDCKICKFKDDKEHWYETRWFDGEEEGILCAQCSCWCEEYHICQCGDNCYTQEEYNKYVDYRKSAYWKGILKDCSIKQTLS